MTSLKKKNTHTRTTFPRLPAFNYQQAGSSGSLRLPLQTGLRTYRRAFRDTHTPLLITPLLISLPPREHQKRPFSGHTGANVTTSGQIKRPFSGDSARHHLRAPSRLSVSSAIITMRQAAWQRCGMKKTQWRRLCGACEARGNTLKTVATSSGGPFRQHSHIFTARARKNSAP